MGQYHEDLLYIFFKLLYTNQAKILSVAWVMYLQITCEPIHSIFLDFSWEIIFPRGKISISARFSVLLWFWIQAPQVHQETAWCNPRENHPRDGDFMAVISRLETEDEPVDPAQRGVCWLEFPGNNGLYCAATTWERDLFMFFFLWFWGIEYSCSFLYLNAAESAGNSSVLLPNTGQLFQKLKSSDQFGALLLWWWLFYLQEQEEQVFLSKRR